MLELDLRAGAGAPAPKWVPGAAAARAAELAGTSAAEGRTMLELDLRMSAAAALAECERHGLAVRSERSLAGQAGSRHLHLGIPGRAGTLEISEANGRVWVKVHPLRDGGWASDLARELAALAGK